MFNRFLIWTGILRPEKSFADIVLNSRRGRSFAIATSALAVISIGINYAMWIFPIFEDPDFGNTAVRNYLSSDFYKTESEDAAKQLDLYNEGNINGRAIDLKFFYPYQGVTVKHEMTLAPREEKRPGGGSKYKFENSFKVSLNLIHLMFFTLLLGGLLAVGVFVFLNRPPKALVELEESILKGYFSIDDKNPPTIELEDADYFALVEKICARFHLVAKQLQSRHGGRDGLEINDEYDTQDLLHALLHIYFDDIRPEEWTPSYAGGGSRVDFLLKDEKIIIEVKKTRPTLRGKDVGAELIVDSQRYKAHPDCKKLLCFVYDPEGWISNPRGLENDLNKKDDNFELKVLIVPKGH
ncbi:PD-(D/E)XK nuclease domain-containing protein [Pseudomonas sp. EL_65y_Pfl2_R96]|uniref:PD-(D/E)XK nuclease domain-containing protein n=1 Tax=Pseudomonas sp. EL_65y_Pfl2_R96 TaxID=3088699 RepID=UPI0030D6D3F7